MGKTFGMPSFREIRRHRGTQYSQFTSQIGPWRMQERDQLTTRGGLPLCADGDELAEMRTPGLCLLRIFRRR